MFIIDESFILFSYFFISWVIYFCGNYEFKSTYEPVLNRFTKIYINFTTTGDVKSMN